MPENMNRPHHARKTRSCSPEKTARTRQQIARAALEEFSAQGFARASISNISKRAGVAKGTVYNYFPTKELLFEAVLKEFIATVRTELESSPRRNGETVKAYLLRVMLPAVKKIDDASTGRARIAHLVMTEGSRFPVIAQAYLREIHQPLQQAMTQLIQEAASAGELKAEQLLCFPCLLLAPNWFGMVYNEVLNPAAPVSTGDLFEAGIGAFFR